MPLRAVLLIGFVLASVPVCFLRPFYGILLWTCLAFVNPQSYSWESEIFPWALAVAIPTMLGMLLFERKLNRLASLPFWLMAILGVWFSITTVVSMNSPLFVHHSADTWEKWKFVSKVLLMTACTIPVVSSFGRLRHLVMTIAGCFGLFIVKSLPFVIATGGAHRLYGPGNSMIADNNDFGLALNMTLPLYFYLAQVETRRWVKRLWGFLFLITIPAIFFTYSRGAVLGLLTVLLLMFLRSRRRFVLVPVIAMGMVIALAFAPEEWRERMDPTREGAMDASARARLNAWGYARNLAADYPITGGGFATFTAELYPMYSPTPTDTIHGAHSVYFQLLAEHGYVGLGLYLLMVLSCFITLRRVRRAALARGDTDLVLYSQMFQFSLVGFLTSGLFLGRAYFDYFFTIVACVSILEHAARDRWAGEKPAVTSRTPKFAPAYTAAALR